MSKRLFRCFAGLASALMAASCYGDSVAGAAQASEPGHVLVAYFSWSGTTERVAKTIAAETGGDLFRIETKEAYPAHYSECADSAQRQQEQKVHPALRGRVEYMEKYDLIFIGCAVGWGSAPMAIHTFLSDSGYNLKGKTIVPFCTYGGDSAGETLTDIVKLTPDSEHMKGYGDSGYNARRIKQWLRSINIIK